MRRNFYSFWCFCCFCVEKKRRKKQCFVRLYIWQNIQFIVCFYFFGMRSQSMSDNNFDYKLLSSFIVSFEVIIFFSVRLPFWCQIFLCHSIHTEISNLMFVIFNVLGLRMSCIPFKRAKNSFWDWWSDWQMISVYECWYLELVLLKVKIAWKSHFHFIYLFFQYPVGWYPFSSAT